MATRWWRSNSQLRATGGPKRTAAQVIAATASSGTPQRRSFRRKFFAGCGGAYSRWAGPGSTARDGTANHCCRAAVQVIFQHRPPATAGPVPWNMNKIALTFLAHPDDAEILCGGTLVRLKEAGWEIHIATCTPGDCGTMTQTPWDISSVRTNEAKASAEMLGATYHCIDERDIFVVYDKPTLRKAIDLFRRVAPTLVFTHAAKDYMMDHEQ